MAAQVTNYQCPACTGPLQFDAGSGMLTCEYCGSDYPISEIEKIYGEKDEAAAQAQEEAEKREEDEREEAVPEGWTCTCGNVNKGKFCPECGDPFDDGDLV